MGKKAQAWTLGTGVTGVVTGRHILDNWVLESVDNTYSKETSWARQFLRPGAR